MCPSLWMLNCSTTWPRIESRRLRHEPVALHLRDEAAQPRPELDTLGVELNRWRPAVLRRPAGCRTSRSARSAADSAAPHRARPAARPRRVRAARRMPVSAGGSARAISLLRLGGAGVGVGGLASPAPAPLVSAPLRRARPSCRARTAADSWAPAPAAAPAPAIEVRQLRRESAARRLQVDARLHEDEPCGFSLLAAAGAALPGALRAPRALELEDGPAAAAKISAAASSDRGRRPTACTPSRREMALPTTSSSW